MSIQKTQAIVLAILLAFSLDGLAGEPRVPLTFKALSMELGLDEPFGKSALIVECSTAKYSYERTLTALILKTEKGSFKAPEKILSGFLNPSNFNMTGLEDLKTGRFEKLVISFEYNPAPYTGEVPGKIVFDLRKKSFEQGTTKR
jgi:hypothetical protein